MLAIQAEEVRASHLPVLLVHPSLRVLAVSPAVRRLLGHGHGDGRGELEGAAVDEVLRVVRVAEPDLRRVLEDAAGGARSRWWEGTIRVARGHRLPVRLEVRRVGLSGHEALWLSLETAPAEAQEDGRAGVTRAGADDQAPRRVPSVAALGSLVGVRAGAGLQLVEDVLHMTAVRSGVVAVRPRACDVGAAVREAVAEHASRAVDRRIGFDVGMPAAPRVLADAEMLRRCIDHVVANAVEQAVLRTSVRCSWREEGARLVLRLTTTMSDLDEDQLDRRFDPWRRGELVVANRTPGVGAGLLVARDLLRLMDGDLRLLAEVPGGFAGGLAGRSEHPVTPRGLRVGLVHHDLDLPLAPA